MLEDIERYSDDNFAYHKALHARERGVSEWQPAVIASHEHVAKLHSTEPGYVSRLAGVVIRVRENEECHKAMHAKQHFYLGCNGRSIEVHPEDAERLFPEDFEQYGNVALCTCAVLMD